MAERIEGEPEHGNLKYWFLKKCLDDSWYKAREDLDFTCKASSFQVLLHKYAKMYNCTVATRLCDTGHSVLFKFTPVSEAEND